MHSIIHSLLYILH